MQRSKLIGAALCSGVFAFYISHAGAQEFTATHGRKQGEIGPFSTRPSNSPILGSLLFAV